MNSWAHLSAYRKTALARGFDADALHHFEGEPGGDDGAATAHLDGDFDGLKQLLEGCAGDSRLLDVPLHAGFTVLDEGDAQTDELFVLLAQSAVRVGDPLHGEEAVVDLGSVGEKFGVGELALK
jgi:hypothetical protein